MAEDPLGVLTGTRASENLFGVGSESGPIQAQLSNSDFTQGPLQAAPAVPMNSFRGQQKEFASMEREVALFFADRPLDAKPPLQRPQPNEVSETYESVRKLLDAGRYRLACRIARLLLDTTDPKDLATRGKLRESLTVGHFHLMEFKEAQDVLKEGGSEQAASTGEEIEPFNVQMMRCELLHYLGSNSEAHRALCALRERWNKVLNECKEQEGRKSIEWKLRVINEKIVAYLVLGGKLELALRMVRDDLAASVSSGARKTALLRKAKILLKIGDLRGTRAATEQYRELLEKEGVDTKQSHELVEMRALVLAAESRFKEAMELLAPLVQGGGLAATADAINNYAVCALFTNQITVAIECMEKAARNDPFQGLNIALVRNLVALYDLCSMREKKAVLRKLVERYASDAVAEESRRLGLW